MSTGETPPNGPPNNGQRIAKWIARAGICSRREAERLIADGRVDLDGEKLSGPGVVVDDPCRISVDGERLSAPEPARLFRFNKPAGLMVTERDPEGRETIYDHLPEGMPRVVPVGRLDLATEGLLLLTTDGELKRRLELPATGWLRRYRARVYGKVDEAKLAALADGITIDGIQYGGIKATLDQPRGDQPRGDQRTGANAWLSISLREGKNREVRRVLDHLGLKVNRLMRTAYGPFQLGNLKSGHIAEVAPKVLAEQLGLPIPEESKVGTAKAKPKTKPKSKPKNAHANRRR